VLDVLTEAYPETVRLCVAFGTGERHRLRKSVDLLRRHGYCIEGVRPAGYRLVKVGA
jgi:hypothetical protein